ncbi:MAG: hypothetical protein GX202_03835 [Firmicutes bacterium]|nr:hypothetical protein [Bacillota bacterium]
MAERDYAYAVGRIRILETKLLPASFFERLLKTASVQETLRLLAEVEYAAEALNVDYEQAFEEELEKVYRFLRGLTNDAPELLVFLHRWDVHNLKLLVVAGEHGQPSKLGVIPFAELKRMVAEGDYPGLPRELAATMANLPASGPERAAALDRAYYRYGQRVFDKGPALLRDYWQARRDLLNLILFLRLQKKGVSVEEFTGFMVEPGVVDRQHWLAQYAEDQPQLTKVLASTPYRNLALEEEERRAALPDVERAIDNLLLGVIAAAKLIPLGIEPIIGYLLAKEREILNLRLVITGKQNKLPEETVRRRLRHVYI